MKWFGMCFDFFMIRFLKVSTLFFNRVLMLAAVALCAQGTARASTNYAASVSFADVSAAINAAAPGDTVVMPPGTAQWTVPFSFQGIHLIGSGTSQTIIVDAMDRNQYSQSPLIVLHGSTSAAEMANFQITRVGTTLNYKGAIGCDAASPVRIHNVFFNGHPEKNLFLTGANATLVDHCLFWFRGIALEIHDTGYGDAAFASPANYGSQAFPFIEDCVFSNLNSDLSLATSVLDAEAGGKMVFRHNTVYNSFYANHGTETGGRFRGCRAFEIYSNTFSYPQAAYAPWAIFVRSGCGVVFGNTSSGQQTFVGVSNYRDFERFAPFGGADGFGPWDNVLATNVLVGTHQGANGVTYLEVPGANWPINQWYGYTVLNQDYFDSKYNFAIIRSNSPTRIFFSGTRNNTGTMTFSNGQHFVLNQIYPMLDQPGRGSGDLVSGDMQPWGLDPYNTVTGVPSWPRQANEGIYSWNNTLNGQPANISSDLPNIQNGRDFFNNTPKPGYTPYTYPHPMQGSGSATNLTAQLLPPARVWVQQ